MFAQAMDQSIKRAEVMQAQAVLYIQGQFAVEDDEALKIEGLTWERFIKDLEASNANDTQQEFEAKIAEVLQSVVEQVFAEGQQ